MSKAKLPRNLRRQVAERSRHRCDYCQTQEEVAGMRFTIDHIIPEALGGTTTSDNLCLACWDCNLLKQSRIAAVDPLTEQLAPLFHPVRQNWQEYFTWEAAGLLIEGLTVTGRATVHALQLNRTPLLRARDRWIKVGWHPPQE